MNPVPIETVVKQCIQSALDEHVLVPGKKTGSRVLHPLILQRLNDNGLDATKEFRELNVHGPAWRYWKSEEIVPAPAGWKSVDVKVTYQGAIVALVEIESDLDDLPANPGEYPRNRNGSYAVKSLARNKGGDSFESYHPLERMAVAAIAWAGQASDAHSMAQIKGNSPAVHNPSGLPLFVAVERCRSNDLVILKPRLLSLKAEILWKEKRG